MNNVSLSVEKAISFFLNKVSDRLTIIAHAPGFAGSLVYRILAADDKFYWSKDISGVLTDESHEPLRWPDKTEGFRINDFSNNQTYIAFKWQHLTMCHIQVPLLEDDNYIDNIIRYYNIISTVNEKLLIRTHDMGIRKLNKDVKIIRIIGNLPNRFNHTENKYKQIMSEKHINTYNVNINNLLSIDYDIFLDEYLNLCRYLNIEPKINSVRSFILMWLDKQSRASNSR